MRRYAPILALGLLACAPTLPPNLNTTEWAKAQDARFAVDTISPIAPLEEFRELDALQRSITPTNLTLRQSILRAAVGDVAAPHRARADYWALSKSGTWAEGYSYWVYVREPLKWYARVTGDTLIQAGELARVDSIYAATVAPDGDIALPEVAAGLHRPPAPPSGPESPFYHLRRWREADTAFAALLIGTHVAVEPRLNLHHHVDAGYFAFWLRGRWVVRAAPYTGWNEEAAITEKGFAELLPPGAIRAPRWRLKPPTVTAAPTARGYRFTWDYGWLRPQVSRDIAISDTGFTVDDRWGFFGHRVREFKAK